MKISIIYNNEARPGFKAGWGFSCFIESGNKNIVFDTGGEPGSLLYNMKKLELDPRAVDIIVISHDHWDHTGGLDSLIKKNGNKAEVILPKKISPFKVSEGAYSTGLLKSKEGPDEQSLLLLANKGIVVLAGCSHPGVDLILKAAKRRGRAHAIIGGFHGFDKLDALAGIDIIGACHCTQRMDEIKKRFPTQFLEVKAGDVFEF